MLHRMRESAQRKEKRMVCDLAVSITRAAVTDQHLKELLNKHPKEVEKALVAYFKHQYSELVVNSYIDEDGVHVDVGNAELTIENGDVTEDSSRDVKSLLNEAREVVKGLATRLFTDEVEQALRKRSTVTGKFNKRLTQGGKTFRATEFNVVKGEIKLRVYALAEGNLQVFVDNGSFEQAKATTLALLEQFQAEGVEVKRTSEVESHRTGGMEHVHVANMHKH